MNELPKTAHILLTGEDAKVFISFKANREKFIAMLAGGVFDLSSGQAVINVNNGQVQSIHIDQLTYKRQSG